MEQEIVNEAIKLLQELIRNECVNPPGNEIKSIRTIEKYLKTKGINSKIYESAPNRGNLIARLTGTKGGSKLMFGPAHVDVVPVDSIDKWSHKPFSADISDNYVWGRGALDMLFIVATQVVIFSKLYHEKFQPKGELILTIVADEECGGGKGIEWLLKNHQDEIKCDFAVSESGGINLSANKYCFMTGEKGATWLRLTFLGTPGHGSMPYGSDNALVKTSEAIKRLVKYKPPIVMKYYKNLVKAFTKNFIFRFIATRKILLPIILKIMLKKNPEMAKVLYSYTHMTISPNKLISGTKTNVIPGNAVLELDIRTLPNQKYDDVIYHIERALGKKLAKEVKIELIKDEGIISLGNVSSEKSKFVNLMEKAAQKVIPNCKLVPLLVTGATDLRFLREIGAESYGFSLLDPKTTSINELTKRAHGIDERISIKSIEYTLDVYYHLAKECLS